MQHLVLVQLQQELLIPQPMHHLAELVLPVLHQRVQQILQEMKHQIQEQPTQDLQEEMDQIVAAQEALLDQALQEAQEVIPEEQTLEEQALEGIQEVLQITHQDQETPRLGIIARIRAVILQVQITLQGMEIAAMVIRQEDPATIKEAKIRKTRLVNRLKSLKAKSLKKKK